MNRPTASLLSGRAQDRLVQLQRLLASEQRTLTNKQSLLLGALRACDRNTQKLLLQEYLLCVESVLAAVTSLQGFILRHAGVDGTPDSVAEGAESLELESDRLRNADILTDPS